MARRRTPILAAALGILAVALGMPAVPIGAETAGDDALHDVVLALADPTDAAAVVAGLGDASRSVEPAPFVSVRVAPEELAALEHDGRVESVVRRGTTVGLAIADSVPLLGAPQRWTAGHRGAGKVIAVLDTGVAADFGGQVVGQACFAATEVSLGTYAGHCGPQEDVRSAFDARCFELGVCGGEDVQDPAAGRPCAITPGEPHRECQHGTAVAAVAARHEPTPGMAPDAGIYSIRVFDPSGSTADLVDVYRALEHVLAMSEAGMDFAAVNLSVATSALFPKVCDDSPALAGAVQAFRFLVERLEARRIPVVAASGNGGQRGSVAFPACLSSTVSVGASDLDDDLAPFTNTGPGLDLLAPGADDTAPGQDPLDIPSAPGTATEWAGTSFAAPHVAGALALLAQEYPTSSVDQRTWLLRQGGVAVHDGGTTYRRMALRSPAEVLHGGVLLPGAAPIGGTARAAMGDFDGDGLADVLAHGPGEAPDLISYGQADGTFAVRPHTVAGSYQPLVGNFRGAAGGPDDVLWYAPGPAGDSIWEGQADRRLPPSPLTIDGTFVPLVGDFDGDGWDDVFWYGPGVAPDRLWYGGAAGFDSRPVIVQGSYRAAVGDFDADGRDDVFFHGPGAAPDSLWQGAGRGAFTKSSAAIDGAHLPLVGDVDGDGSDDLFLYAPGPTIDLLWRGGGAVAASGAAGFLHQALPVEGTYTPAIGDLDGDGRDDIVWHAPGPATDSIWFGQASGKPRGRNLAVSGAYQPLVGDVDGLHGDDIVWLGSGATTTPVWWSHTATP